MKAYGKFVYKSLEKRDGGEFTNSSGQTIKYEDSYVLKIDENVDGSINERKLKVDKNNIGLINQLKDVKTYSEIELECDVQLYQNSCKLIPVRLTNSNNK